MIDIVKQWKSSDTCAKHECIKDIVFNNEMLALLIMNESEKTIHMELRSAESLNHIWSIGASRIQRGWNTPASPVTNKQNFVILLIYLSDIY